MNTITRTLIVLGLVTALGAVLMAVRYQGYKLGTAEVAEYQRFNSDCQARELKYLELLKEAR